MRRRGSLGVLPNNKGSEWRDWMVIGQIMLTNPAAAVRGPRHIVRRGKTPVLDPAEARQLIDAIDPTTVIGLRDRALSGLMVFLRAHRRGDRHARRGRVHAEPPPMGAELVLRRSIPRLRPPL